MVVSWQTLEQETSISRRRSPAVVAKVRGGKRTSRALHRAATAGRVVPTTPRRRRRQRDWISIAGFVLSLHRRSQDVAVQSDLNPTPNVPLLSHEPPRVAAFQAPGLGGISNRNEPLGGVCLARQKKLELPGSCQLKRRPPQSQSRGKDDGWMRCAIFCHRPVVFCVVVEMDILCF